MPGDMDSFAEQCKFRLAQLWAQCGRWLEDAVHSDALSDEALKLVIKRVVESKTKTYHY